MARICLVVLAIFALLNIVALIIYGIIQMFQASILGGIYLIILAIGLVTAMVLWG